MASTEAIADFNSEMVALWLVMTSARWDFRYMGCDDVGHSGFPVWGRGHARSRRFFGLEVLRCSEPHGAEFLKLAASKPKTPTTKPHFLILHATS